MKRRKWGEKDAVTWTLPREDARDLLAYLRRNRPLGMPDRTLDGLVTALLDADIATRSACSGGDS